MSQNDLRHNAPPRVLVLLASYEGHDWIEAQIGTILSQCNVSISLLVSDDHSRDGTGALIRSLAATDPRVDVLESTSASGSAGANFRRLLRGADATDFDFVALADQDDIWLDDKLFQAIQQLDRMSASGYSSSVTAFWRDGRERTLHQSPRWRTADFLFEGAGQGCTFVLTAEFFRTVQFFCLRHAAQADALHYHDWLIYLLARADGRRWIFDSESRIRYRQHESNEIGARGGIGAALHRLRKIRDGWFRRQVEAAIDAYVASNQRNPIVERFRHLLSPSTPRNLSRRFRMATLLIQHSRRRASDRMVLVVATLLGWL